MNFITRKKIPIHRFRTTNSFFADKEAEVRKGE